jgi:hypothetical protein
VTNESGGPENRAGEERAPTLRPSPDVIARRMGQAAVLVHLGTNRIYEVNETGARIWELLQEGCDRRQLQARIVAEFDVDEATASQAIDALVEMLSAEGLIGGDEPGG